MSEQARSRVAERVSEWEGVTAETSSGPFDEVMTFFHLGKRELGHLHGGQVAHIPFPRAVREDLFATGRARQHSAGFPSHVEVDLESGHGAEQAIELLRMSYERATAAAERTSNRSSPGQ